MLTTIEKVLFLQNVDVFEEVPTEYLSHLAVVADEVDILAGEKLFSESDRSDALFLVISGSIRMHQGDIEITVAARADAIGTWALFDEEPRVASATALEDTSLLRITRDDFLDVLADHVQVTQGVLKKMASRLRTLMSRVNV